MNNPTSSLVLKSTVSINHVDTPQDPAWAAFNTGRLKQAESLCIERLQQQPLDMDMLFLMGLLAKQTGKITKALACFSSVVRRSAHSLQAWHQLSLTYEALYETSLTPMLLEKAHEAVNRALCIDERFLLAWYQRAHLYVLQNKVDQALATYECVLAMGIDNATTRLAMAKTLHDLRRFDEAESNFTAALAAQPKNANWQWEYAMQLLMTGRFAEGWQHYDARLEAYDWMNSGLQMYPFKFPLWQGEDLKNKTILVHGEQGLGDEIMFAAVLPELMASAGKVVLACSPSLVDLFTRSFSCEVVGHYRGFEAVQQWQQDRPPAFLKTLSAVDFQCPLGSLPRYFRKERTDFEKSAPYLKVSEQLKTTWQQKLLQKRCVDSPRLRVGLMWCGNLATGKMGANKSIALSTLAPLFAIDGIEWVSLQSSEYGKQLQAHTDLKVIDVSDDIKSFDDTAAIMANLDVVISVDTSVAHLAGAMGKPVWVPLCLTADWRWLAEGSSSVWYASMELIRQTQSGDWAPVTEVLKQRLLERLAKN